MEENNIIIENGIRLQDGNVIRGYPKQDAIVELCKKTPMLDTTEEYLSIGKNLQSPSRRMRKRVTCRNYLQTILSSSWPIGNGFSMTVGCCLRLLQSGTV